LVSRIVVRGSKQWFHTLTGDYRDGADYWSIQRSLLTPGSCSSQRYRGQDFVYGCVAAKQRLDPTNIRRNTEPGYKAGRNAYSEHPASQSPGTSSLFKDGLTARAAWEQWFSTQVGDYRDGAKFWAGQRSLPGPDTCPGAGRSQTFVSGCMAAKAMLDPMEHRRRSEPDYRAGWNTYTEPAGTPASGTGGLY